MRLRSVLSTLLLLLTAGAARAQTVPVAPVLMTLPSGIRLLVKREPDAPLVAMQVFVRVGVGQETSLTAGESQFVARTLLLSTTTRPPSAMAQDIGALGGSVSTTWTPDWTQIGALTVPDRVHQTIELLMDVLENADFDAEGVEDARQTLLGDQENADADLYQTAYAAARQILYAGSPYAQPGTGTAASLKRLDRSDLQRFFQRYYTPRNTTIVIVGKIDPEQARREIETAAQDFSPARLSRHADTTPIKPPARVQDTPPVRTKQTGLTQIAALVSYRVMPPSDPDYPALLIVNALLGGMKSSRLFAGVRDGQGLAYDISSVINAQQAAADLTAYAFAAPTRTSEKATPQGQKPERPSVGETLRGALEQQVASLTTTPPTPAELTRAQHFLIGSYKIRHERIEDRATLLGTAEMLHGDSGKFDTDYARVINAVTLADIQRVAATSLTHPVVSLVEPGNIP